jgi:hypothetical protein
MENRASRGKKRRGRDREGKLGGKPDPQEFYLFQRVIAVPVRHSFRRFPAYFIEAIVGSGRVQSEAEGCL